MAVMSSVDSNTAKSTLSKQRQRAKWNCLRTVMFAGRRDVDRYDETTKRIFHDYRTSRCPRTRFLVLTDLSAHSPPF